VAGDLGDDGCYALVQLEVSVLHEEPAHAAKIDGREKVLNIKVKKVAAMAMLAGVGNDRPLPLKAVGDTVLAVFLLVDLVDTVLKQVRELALY
jgi:hypothetical protein